MRVLAICAHPDDIELQCAGTLVKCKKRGDEVIACHISDGNMGHMVIPPDELGIIRRGEAQKSGSIAGIEVIWGGMHDLDIYYNNKAARDAIVKIIRYADPDLIIAPDPSDYMCDHTEAARLVFDASFCATVPHYEPQLGKAAKVTPIYYMGTASQMGFVPTEYVDITEEMETKKAMFNCHESQLVWLRDHDHIDPAEKMIVTARFYGFQSGAEYAEAFRQCVVEGRMTTKRLLP